MYAASDQMLQCPSRPLVMERRWKSNVELAPNCPRCASQNTKFCYYNNYSLSQPRYFCKGCRRYWTKGGSLRNVPVGGGCRKSRRAKVVRSAQSERSSTFPSVGSSPSPGRMVSPSRSDGSDIDLAAVFAKFLNQNSSIGNTELVGSDLFDFPGSSNQDTQLEDAMFECQTPSRVTQEAVQLRAGLPQVLQQEEQIQEFVGHDPNSFGLETMLGDGLDQDLLWSDVPTLPNFACQPMAQLQEFGSFSSDDQSEISASVTRDNWSLFDLSAYEIFS